jgi:hypothetical protein
MGRLLKHKEINRVHPKCAEETGQYKKAVATAKKIKIESTAIKGIQEGIRKIIEKQDMFNPKEKGRKYNLQVAIASYPAPFLKKKVR